MKVGNTDIMIAPVEIDQRPEGSFEITVQDEKGKIDKVIITHEQLLSAVDKDSELMDIIFKKLNK